MCVIETKKVCVSVCVLLCVRACVRVCVEVISRRNETKPALDGRAKSEKFLTLNDFFSRER